MSNFFRCTRQQSVLIEKALTVEGYAVLSLSTGNVVFCLATKEGHIPAWKELVRFKPVLVVCCYPKQTKKHYTGVRFLGDWDARTQIQFQQGLGYEGIVVTQFP